MSPYFGALMRASGLAPADAQQEFVRQPAQAQPLASAPPRATAIGAPPAENAAADAVRTEAGSDAGSASGAERPARGPSLPRDRAARETGLLAALQWVRADPALARLDESGGRRAQGIEGETAGPAPGETPSPIAATFAHEEPSTVVRHAQALATPVPPAAQGFPAVLDERSSRAQETVEVSIGAIHVRVDAPPPRTVVTAPAPAPRPKAPSSADHPRARCGLSRRALRTL